MDLMEQALLKIEGKYPTLKDTYLWEIVQYDQTTGSYSKLISRLYARDLMSSTIQVTHNGANNSLISVQDLSLYNRLVRLIGEGPVLFVRNLPIKQWFVLDSVSSSKIIDEDLGIETWSYDFNLLDPVSILQFILVANNQYQDVPLNPPDDYELPEDYLKFAVGAGTEVFESYIIKELIDHTLVNGFFTGSSNNLGFEELTFKGLLPTERREPLYPVYSAPKTSWVNFECGEIYTLEKISELNFECPILGTMIDDNPVYAVYDSPNLNKIEDNYSNKDITSYTAGFQHSDKQVVVGLTKTFPAMSMFGYTQEQVTPYKKMAVVNPDLPEGTSYNTGTSKIVSLILNTRTKQDIVKFLDAQMVSQLKPWEDYILGDAVQIGIDDVEGFSKINLMIVGITETIEADSIIYTITLEELEDSYATI